MSELRSAKRFETLAAHIDRLAKNAALEAERKLPPNEPTAADLKARIDAEFWKQIGLIVEGLVQPDLGRQLVIGDEDALFLNFGVFAHPRLAAAAEAAKRWAAHTPGGSAVISWFADGIQDAYREALRVETLAKLRRKLDAVNHDLDEWPDMHLEHIKYRDRLVTEALGATPQAQHVMRLYSELDERLEQYKRMERHSQTEGWHTNDERKRWIAMKQYMDERWKGISQVLDPLARQARSAKEQIGKAERAVSARRGDIREHRREIQELEQLIAQNREMGERGDRLSQKPRQQINFLEESIRRADEELNEAEHQIEDVQAEFKVALAADGVAAAGDAVLESLNHLLDLRNERRLVESQIIDEENAVHQITQSDVKVALANETANVRGLLRLSAKYAKINPCPLPVVDGQQVIEPEAAIEALDEIEKYDPDLFINPGVKRLGKPSIFLAPGDGDGVFDADRNRLLIPQRSTKGVLASVANAVVLYRLDTDSAYNERKLFRSYKEDIKEHAKVRSNLKLRMGLIKNYLIWITKESQGNPLLPREVREWFEWNIAPRKTDPMLPREYRGLAIRQIRQKIEEVERQPASPDRAYRLAVLRWMMAPEEEANIRDAVLPMVEKAMAQAPENMDYIYSAATLYKKVRQHQKAIDLFSRYSRDARQSWWTKKAIELCSQCR